MRRPRYLRFVLLTGAALCAALLAGPLAALWLQRVVGFTDKAFQRLALLPAVAVLTVAHRRLRRGAPERRGASVVAPLAVSVATGSLLFLGLLSRGTFWWRDALALSADGVLLLLLLLVLGWCAIVAAIEWRTGERVSPVASQDPAP